MAAISQNIVMFTRKRSSAAEAYRKLRTNLLYSKNGALPKIIVITSSIAGEGKTTTSCNLAIAFAQTGRKVLLIDCDVRKPAVHMNFGIGKVAGVSKLLKNQLTIGECIQTIEEAGIDIIPSGPSMYDPTELYSSPHFVEVFSQLREMYDVIIVDTPPVGVVTDAALISHVADGCIMVAAEGTVTISQFRNAKEHLDRSNAAILGVVFNKMGSVLSKNSYYYKYYYSSYGTYGNETRTRTRKKVMESGKKSGKNNSEQQPAAVAESEQNGEDKS